MYVMTVESERQQELLDALRTNGDWMSRNDLAAIDGRKRLTPYDVELLQGLANQGLVEIDQQPAGISQKYVYKAT